MGCSDKRRFELELEFLHCLANPGYLNCEWGWQPGAARASVVLGCLEQPSGPSLGDPGCCGTARAECSAYSSSQSSLPPIGRPAAGPADKARVAACTPPTPRLLPACLFTPQGWHRTGTSKMKPSWNT